MTYKTPKRKVKEKYDKEGYLQKVINSKGTKPKVAIVQDFGEGFKARLYNSPYTDIARGKNAEALAKKIAKRGHKEVVFLE